VTHGKQYGSAPNQWSLRKTRTMGILPRKAEIGVCVQAPGRLRMSGGTTPEKSLKLYMQNPAI